jgi:potassium voltage-gated channel Eag-related subfamily H protein
MKWNISFEKYVFINLETPIWVFMQIAPITNERDTVVLYLCTFTDITALKQPIETEDTKGGLSKFARIAKSVTRNRSILMNFAAPNTKSIHIDPTKPSQLPNVNSLISSNVFYLRLF